jgi:hypothetical protein
VLVQLAPGIGCGAAHCLSSLASTGIPALLALEVHTWKTPAASGPEALTRCMARDNPTWGEERIGNQLLLKLGLQVSPRTVRKYLPKRVDHGRRKRATSQRWRTFVRSAAIAS